MSTTERLEERSTKQSDDSANAYFLGLVMVFASVLFAGFEFGGWMLCEAWNRSDAGNQFVGVGYFFAGWALMPAGAFCAAGWLLRD